MITMLPWVASVLRKCHLSQEVPRKFDFARSQLVAARSHLAERMDAAVQALESEAGRRLMYGEMYVQPHKIIRRYIFERDTTEFNMSLVILPAGPTLIFSALKADDWVDIITHPLTHHMKGGRVSVKYNLLIDPEAVSDTDLEEWFTYLLSGLRRSFKPEHKIPRPKM